MSPRAPLEDRLMLACTQRLDRRQFIRRGTAFGVSLSALGLLAGCGGDDGEPAGGGDTAATAEAQATPIKIGLVYVGPIGDTGWTYTHEQGRLYLEENVEMAEATGVENAGAEEDARRVLLDMARQDTDLAFVTSVSLQEVALEIGEREDMKMMVASGFQTGPNVGAYMASTYEGFYLAGLVAGAMTESDRVGYVTSFAFPEFLRDINGFAMGVKESNPDATVHLVWTSTFFDPGVEREAALTLIDAGADVIAQEQDSPAVQQAAQERGVYSISSNTDLRDFAPEAVLTGPTYDWGEFYAEQANRVREGTWEPEQHYLGFREGVVGLAPLHDDVPEDVRQQVEERRQELEAGESEIFRGPIEDQDGNVRIPEGESWGAEQTGQFDFLVDNVVGSPTG